jgi:hypothetical protein
MGNSAIPLKDLINGKVEPTKGASANLSVVTSFLLLPVVGIAPIPLLRRNLQRYDRLQAGISPLCLRARNRNPQALDDTFDGSKMPFSIYLYTIKKFNLVNVNA